MLRWGPVSGPVVVVALPLFEEANRVRAFAVSICRALAEAGLASALPDLPGTGESLALTQEAQIEDWREAFAAACAPLDRPHVASIRGGALVTRSARAASCWLLASTTGDDIIRDLSRVRRAVDPTTSGDLFGDAWKNGPPIAIGGTVVSRAMIRDLQSAVPDRTTPSRQVRLSTDPAEAERKVDGVPLWRRAEPGNDVALAQELADDIVQWVRACEGC